MNCSQLSSPSGINIADVVGLEKLSAEHLAITVKKMTVNYGDAFLNKESDEFQRVLDIFERCQKLGWSKNEYFERLEEFLDERRWHNFTRADFMNKERRKLYNRAWYLEQVAKNPSAEFEAYYVPTDQGEIIMYRFRSEKRIQGLRFVEAFEQKTKRIDDNSRLLEESSIDKEANKKILDDALKKFYSKSVVKQVKPKTDSTPAVVEEIHSEALDPETVQKQLQIIQDKYGKINKN